MGLIDTEGKSYLSNNKYFADAFNFLLYNGRQVIKPGELRELDTTQIAIPYGNGARIPTQKYRDLLKLWSAMMDDKAVYLMLGAELQDKIHYAVPVKNGLYDMLGYARQVEEARRSYRKKEDDTGDMFVKDGTLRIKLTSEEFLSGFRKEDKLMPIITAVIYLSPEPWDGPLSLYDMLNVEDKELLRFIPNYPVNLIAPANIDDNDFGKFHTDLGLAMKVLKYQNSKVDQILVSNEHETVDRSTAVFLNKVANLGLELEDEEGDVDMNVVMEKRDKKNEVNGAIKLMKSEGKTEKEIIERIVEIFDVTKEYVLALLSPQKS